MTQRDPEFLRFIHEACKSNEDAANFLVAMTEAAHFFDDLYDGDTTISKDDILNALWSVMVTLPRNEFYRKFFAELQPLVTNAIINWRVANDLEGMPRGEQDLRVAFVVRSSYADLIQQTALICGGPEWAAKVGAEVRRRCHSEPWREYLQSVETHHGNVQRAENARRQPGHDRVGPSERTDRAGTDGPWPRAVRVGEAERSVGPPDAGADHGATDPAG